MDSKSPRAINRLAKAAGIVIIAWLILTGGRHPTIWKGYDIERIQIEALWMDKTNDEPLKKYQTPGK
ncbi:MAG: hypothetical protein AAGA58_20350, partial [Verrucomicrobiota bacterium]